MDHQLSTTVRCTVILNSWSVTKNLYVEFVSLEAYKVAAPKTLFGLSDEMAKGPAQSDMVAFKYHITPSVNTIADNCRPAAGNDVAK